MAGFWDSLFGGTNSSLSTAIGATGQIAGTQTGQGQKNQNTATNFWDAIVSGDATKQTQALAPDISALKTSAAGTNKTNAIFGNRSGGGTASAAATDDKVHGDITNLIGSLTNSSASNLASTGTSQVNTGLQAYNQNVDYSQQQLQNWSNSIFGLGVTKAAGFGEGLGLSAISSLFSGSNQNNQNND